MSARVGGIETATGYSGLGERARLLRHIAIVTHGGVLDVLYRAASRIALDAPRTWQLGNASINRVLHGERGFTLVGWNDGFHLEGDDPLDEASA